MKTKLFNKVWGMGRVQSSPLKLTYTIGFAQQGGGGLDGGGERAVPRAHAKKSSSLARGGIGGKTEQLVSRTVVGQPLAADVEQPNTGQLCRQPLGKVYSGETSLK